MSVLAEKKLTLRLKPTARVSIDEMAKKLSTDKETLYASDVVRLALDEFFEKRGDTIDLDVERRGGDRKSSEYRTRTA